ncbi:iron transporter [Methylobacterium sp. J-076]|uniref:iron transporter n=1 Tax=Methylobacterium sp. J-076 TaxID=2836655 RepID=UPI001FB998BE|nr:iron transporter [Methylobacterium sp. J-076]MCJ2012358.1 iron transporter [Methylobacterium sp. J-076]
MANDSLTDGVPPDPASRKGSTGLGDRLGVAGRVVLAIIGGYAVAALATALGALILPLPRAEAVSAATMASFAVMAGAVVFVFATPSLGRAVLGIAGSAAILAAALWLVGGFSPTGPA